MPFTQVRVRCNADRQSGLSPRARVLAINELTLCGSLHAPSCVQYIGRYVISPTRVV